MTSRRPRDLSLLDALDLQPRQPISSTVWRVVREGRDPLQAAASNSRWCNGDFDVLYTCHERDGALAEIYALLASQPVFPSKIMSYVHEVEFRAEKALIIQDLDELRKFGVDSSRYRERDYVETQAIADAAYFLGFDSLVAPSARWPCLNAILFTDHLDPAAITLTRSEENAVDWSDWRRSRGGAGRS